mgnify:CR=1 FL=1
MEIINFFAESLKNLKTIGAVVPCSSVSARKMTGPIDFSKAKTIVELGGGTGAVTREILKRLSPNAKLIVFETNRNFVTILKNIDDVRLTIIEGSAAHMASHLKGMDVREADYVISTLPLVNMGKGTEEKILEAVRGVLGAEGRYVQIQYSLVSKNRIKQKFGNVKVDFTPLNFPPAFFYICER